MSLMDRGECIISAIGNHFRLWLLITLAFPLVYYAILLAALLIRFSAFPNYMETYDWWGSVQEIFSSTPSISDAFAIVAEEWIFEIGHMNYDFGNGISEWSLNIIPAKVAVVCLLAASLATVVALIVENKTSCTKPVGRWASGLGGLGGLLVAMTSVTLSWVVCCATPSWIVGLAILGLGVSTSLWLEQFGPWMEYSGFILILISIYVLSGKAVKKKNSDIHPMAKGALT